LPDGHYGSLETIQHSRKLRGCSSRLTPLPASVFCFTITIMTDLARYLTHPQVRIDPAAPVPLWGLNSIGRARAQALGDAAWLSGTTQIISSGERKAIETAEIIAKGLRITVEIRQAMHENDRSATGFLEPDEFELVADQFFAHPLLSVRGWERAVDAQLRIVREVEQVLGRNQPGDVLFVGHGAVGTLLLCHYSGLAIDRAYDQPAGGGNCFAFTKQSHRILHPWRRMEDL
jgi:broad specificity phosphatase PhoE